MSDLSEEIFSKDDFRDWRMAEKKLAKAQERAQELRDWEKGVAQETAKMLRKWEKGLACPHHYMRYESEKEFYAAFPSDELGRQDKCKDFYGYTVGVPPFSPFNLLKFGDAALESLSFSPFSFSSTSFLLNVGRFGMSRTIDFLITDKNVDRFDSEIFIMGRSVAALGFIKKFIEKSKAVENAKKYGNQSDSDEA